MERREFLKSAGIAGGLLTASPSSLSFGAPADEAFPLMDLHCHLTPNHDRPRDGNRRKDRCSVRRHGEFWRRRPNDDAGLRRFIDSLQAYPVYYGLQPMSPGWSKNFSPEAIKLVDYVLMEPQTIPNGNGYGETLRIWNFDTYVDDPQKFMETYVTHSLEVIENNEPVNIFGWPLFLPVCIARDYYTLWTEERMQKIIAALKKRGLAVEINDLAHTPHERFILMAKDRG